MAGTSEFLDAEESGEESDWSLVDPEEMAAFNEEEEDIEMDDEENSELDESEEDDNDSDADMGQKSAETKGAAILRAEDLFAKAEAARAEKVKGLPVISERSGAEKVTASYDLGHLSCFAPLAFDSSDARLSEELLLETAVKHTQALVNELFALPNKPDSDHSGLVARLPPARTRLPRAKPVPAEKALTRWQKFALRKGIRKKRKNRDWLEWDESAQEFKRKWGFNRANDPLKKVVFEHNEDDFSKADPFTGAKKAKEKRVFNNDKNRRANIEAAAGERVPGTVDLRSAVLAARKREGGARVLRQLAKVKSAKFGHLDTALSVAQHSTGSMGKFDRLSRDEPTPALKRGAKVKAAYMRPHLIHDRKKHGRDRDGAKVRLAERRKQREIMFQVFGKEETDAFDKKKAGTRIRNEIVYKHKHTKHRSGKKGR